MQPLYKIISIFLFSITLLACGGGSDGNGTNTQTNNDNPFDVETDISKLYSVTTNLNAISYPDSYLKPTTVQSDVNTNVCDLDLEVVTVPRDWIGLYPLPDINGSPLQSTILRGLAIKDIMLDNNPSFIDGCAGNLQEEFIRTIDRLVLLGVDTVLIPQWQYLSARGDGTWYVVSADNTFGPLSDSNLAFFANLATTHGIQIFMSNQIQGFVDEEGDPLDPSAGTPPYIPAYSSEDLPKWFRAYQDFVAERSIFFESIGIDIWEVGCDVCLFAPYLAQTQAEFDLHAQEYEKAIETIRTNYSGQLLTYFGRIDEYPNLLNKIDLIGLSLFFEDFTEEEMNSLTVSNLKEKLLGNRSNIDRLQATGKPLFINLNMQSRGNAFIQQGYLEVTECTSDFNGNVSEGVCLQRDVDTDFSIQAIYYEAVFEFLNSQSFARPPTIMAGDYWVTDSIQPTNVFPNIGGSFRNKPAEGLVKTWFAR